MDYMAQDNLRNAHAHTCREELFKANDSAAFAVKGLRAAHRAAVGMEDQYAQIAIMDALEAAVNLQRRVAQLLQAANEKQ